MFFRRRADTPASRGQSMVEFALILPILVLFLLLAVDFGRVFFGWVGIQNASRIGANQAARDPEPWSDGTPDALYYQRIAEDLQAINCDADTDDDGDIDDDDLPPPMFTDGAGTADIYEIGDHVSVTLECGMSFVTPLVGLIVGDPMPISAQSSFTVYGGTINGVPVAEEPTATACLAGEREVPQLVGLSVATARGTWTNAGFSFDAFSPAPAVDDANLVITQTTSPASNPGDCLSVTATVVVTHTEPEECTAPEINVPILVGLTVAEARDVWDNDFTGTFSPATGNDDDIVKTQTTSPSAGLLDCADPSTSVTVTFGAATPPPPPTCEMKQVLGKTPAEAQSQYQTIGFTGSFTTKPSDKPTWKVKSQSLIGGQTYPCTASLEVDLENK
jgi:hypothetical protein